MGMGKEVANALAQQIADELPEGFEPSTWNNLGWHAEARLNRRLRGGFEATVRQQTNGTYRAEIKLVRPAMQGHAGARTLQFFGEGFTPRLALRQAWREMEAERSAIVNSFNLAGNTLEAMEI